jgi:glycosyltransferase involved in cell wall biosynthesis
MDITDLKARAPESVSFLSRYVDDREIPSIFAAADLCVLPYREIDQSGVLATALAFQTPLLLSDAGGFPEVEEAGAAECFPVGDADALAAKLTALLSDDLRRATLKQGALELADGPWSWSESARLHLELYDRLLDGRPASETLPR